MADVETIYLRGEGGYVHAFDLPLPEPIAERVARGEIVQVNGPDDLTPYIPDAKPKRARAPKKATENVEPLTDEELARAHDHSLPADDPAAVRDALAKLAEASTN